VRQAIRLLAALHEAGAAGSVWLAGGRADFDAAGFEVLQGSGWLALGRAARRYARIHALDASAHSLARWAGLLSGRPLLRSWVGEEPPPRLPVLWGGGQVVLPHAEAGWPTHTPVVGEVVPHHAPNVNRVRDWLDAKALRAAMYVGWVGATAAGLQQAVAVLEALRHQGTDAALLALGWGPSPAALPPLARWIDRYQDPEAADFFWTFNGLVATESSWAARLGVAEAFQQRVPVVAPAGLLSDVLPMGRAQPDTDLAQALLRAWEDASATAAQVEAGFAWAQTRHRPDAVARQLLALYAQEGGR
jgi:hypothetical protein